MTLDAWDLFSHMAAAILGFVGLDLGIAFLMRTTRDAGPDGD